MSELHPTVARVTERVVERSRDSRRRYLELMDVEGERHRDRNVALPCSNLAHGFAAAGEDKDAISTRRGPNIGVISAYNDTISAHQPYGAYPPQLKVFAREVGATCQVAGATPAMCDGVTQGLDGMELSLFSRDVIALAAAVGLSHQMYDSPTVAASAITSRLNRLSSIPSSPWVTPSHIAGVAPATWQVAPTSRAKSLSCGG